jgi:hypothetical protein
MPEPSTFKPVTDAVKQAVKDVSTQMINITNDVTSKFRSTFSDEMEELVSFGETIFGRVQTAVTPMFSYLTRFFFKSKFLQETSSTLKGLLKIEKKREKRDLAKMGLGKKGILDMIMQGLGMGLGMILGSIAATLGAAVGIILAPLIGGITEPIRMAAKALKMFTQSKPFQSVMKFLRGDSKIIKAIKTEIGYFTSWIKSLTKLINPRILDATKKSFGIIAKVFGKIGKLAKWIMGSPLGKGFLWGFKKGLKWIFWPIQVVMSAIEFVKGFMSTEGDFVDKFAGGVKAVIKDFFGVPIELLGNLIDWVAEKFGIENLGATKFLTDSFNFLVDAIYYIPLKIKDWLKEAIGNAFNWAKTNINIGETLGNIFSFITDFLDSIWIGLQNLVNELPDWMKSMIKKSNVGDALLSGLEKMAEGATERQSDKLAEEQLKVQKETLEQQKMLNKKTLGNTQINAPTTGGSGSGRQTPSTTKDTKDVMNESWAMDPMMSDRRLKRNIEYLGVL